mmetsp:Transcript_6090/g.10794  ORF Transcript_6090/g.10794 Transcript_6090/m.10794 type:complete len:272 (-) Transcript_6090:24-839(-)
MFALAMLVRLGRITENDVKLTFQAFRRLDVDNDGVLNSKDIIMGQMQKQKTKTRVQTKSEGKAYDADGDSKFRKSWFSMGSRSPHGGAPAGAPLMVPQQTESGRKLSEHDDFGYPSSEQSSLLYNYQASENDAAIAEERNKGTYMAFGSPESLDSFVYDRSRRSTDQAPVATLHRRGRSTDHRMESSPNVHRRFKSVNDSMAYSPYSDPVVDEEMGVYERYEQQNNDDEEEAYQLEENSRRQMRKKQSASAVESGGGFNFRPRSDHSRSFV